MSAIAIITARGGSKRIPRKNIKPFLGKPIIAYSIQTALASNLFTEVMVSTDDEEIAEVALSYGASVPFFRTRKNSDDHATTVEVLLEVLAAYAQQGTTFDYGCCIYPTAPFITQEQLKQAYGKLVTKKLDTVFPVIPFSFPIQRALQLNKSGKIEMFQPKHIATRSQDLEPAYHDSGQFYWFESEVLVSNKKLWTANTGVIILSEMEAHDIDNVEDWKVAEFKFKILTNAKT